MVQSAGFTRFKRLEGFRWFFYIFVPVGIGYGLGRYPAFWEWYGEKFPSAAANQKGPYLPKELTDKRPTLQSEYHMLLLESAIDGALKEIREGKEDLTSSKK